MSQRVSTETPYRKYRRYYSRYSRIYRRTHPDYRARQKELQRKRYQESREIIIRQKGEYIRAIYDNWFGSRPRNTSGAEVALAAEKLAVRKILPKEGFTNILWTQPFKSERSSTATAGSFWMFDAFAVRDGGKCAIQITTSPYRQTRNRRAVSAFLRFFGLTLYVCTVNPDLKRYYLSQYSPNTVPQTVMMTAKRVKQMKTIQSVD